MRVIAIFIFLLLITACSAEQAEELAFRKVLEYELIELCGDEDNECIAAVKAQIKDCMVKSNWRDYFNAQEDEAELRRFTIDFYSCIVDPEGEPYFESIFE